MKRCIFLILLLGLSPIAPATRIAGFPTNEELVARSEWIFVARVQRYQVLPDDPNDFFHEADIKYVVRVIRSLRGTQPAFVAMRGSAVPPSTSTDGQRDFVFFANRPNPPVAGIHGLMTFGGMRNLKELKTIQQLINAKSSAQPTTPEKRQSAGLTR